MNPRLLRWGILGTANIARKNWQAIHLSGNGVLTAVASRDAARAARFIAECQSTVPLPVAPRAFGSYEELLAAPDVDAVYVPLPTGVRTEWVVRAARAGKHVLCEKPCAPSLPDLRLMTSACQEHGVQFMDGVMFVHSARMAALRAVLKEGVALGELRRVTSQFSFCGDAAFFSENMRADRHLEPQGCLGDLGWYSLVFTLEVLGGRLPRAVTARVLNRIGSAADPQPAPPSEFSGELLYDGGVSASFYCSFLTGNQQWASVSGSQGHLLLRDFVLPFFGCESSFEIHKAAFEVSGCHFAMEPHVRRITVPEYGNNHPTAQETRMFREFARQVASGVLNAEWPERSLNTQRLLDACLESGRNDGRPVLMA